MNKKLNINQMQAGFANWHLDKKGAMILMASIMVARGSSFIFSKWLMDGLEPMNVLAVRFTLAFVILAAIFYKKLMALDKKTLFKGILLGQEDADIFKLLGGILVVVAVLMSIRKDKAVE